MHYLHSIWLILISLSVSATVFQKQPIAQQVKEADGIVIGHYLRSKYVELENGSIATQMIFKMNKEVGMQSDIYHMDEIIVHYPGGRLGDKEVRVEGVPEFITGESVVLMIKSFDDRYWGLNLGFGSFKVVNYGNQQMLVNTIFPEDRKVGQIKLEDFETLVRTIKGLRLKEVVTQFYPTERDGFSQRSPASIQYEGKKRAIASGYEQVENNDEGLKISNFWLIFILAIMGALFRVTRQKEVK